MLNNLNVDGIDLASECGSYPCPSLFAAMDGGMVCVLGHAVKAQRQTGASQISYVKILTDNPKMISVCCISTY
jgi:hypothetical protein